MQFFESYVQWRTYVEIVGSDELLHHLLNRQDRVNFWGDEPPRPPTAVFLCKLPRLENFETMSMNFFNYYRLNNIYKRTSGSENKQNVFGQIDSRSFITA